MSKLADIKVDSESVTEKENPFKDPFELEKWRHVYQLCDYEGLPFLDADLEWSADTVLLFGSHQAKH